MSSERQPVEDASVVRELRIIETGQTFVFARVVVPPCDTWSAFLADYRKELRRLAIANDVDLLTDALSDPSNTHEVIPMPVPPGLNLLYAHAHGADRIRQMIGRERAGVLCLTSIPTPLHVATEKVWASSEDSRYHLLVLSANVHSRPSGLGPVVWTVRNAGKVAEPSANAYPDSLTCGRSAVSLKELDGCPESWDSIPYSWKAASPL
jgi:hypothetical protein